MPLYWINPVEAVKGLNIERKLNSRRDPNKENEVQHYRTNLKSHYGSTNEEIVTSHDAVVCLSHATMLN